VQKRPYKECAGEKVPNITSECVGLRETYFNCKSGQACPDPITSSFLSIFFAQ
jgi:cytochrome c oxidase assembly factor 5